MNIETEKIEFFSENKEIKIKSIVNKISPVIKEENINIKTVKQRDIKVSIQEKNKIFPKIITGGKGEKGEPGEKGDPGSGSASIYVAGETIGGHRGVIIKNNLAYYVDNTNLSHINYPTGISYNASNISENLEVYFFGEMEEVSWNWNIDLPIWISTNGLLTQIPPTSGFSCIIAFPITTTKIFIDKQEILLLV